MAQQYINDTLKATFVELNGIFSNTYYGVNRCNQNHTICKRTCELLKIVITEKKKILENGIKMTENITSQIKNYLEEIKKPVTYYSENTIINRVFESDDSDEEEPVQIKKLPKKVVHPLGSNNQNNEIKYEMIDENIIRPYYEYHPSLKLDHSYIQYNDLFFGINSYNYTSFLEKILTLLTNPFCKSCNEKEIDNLMLEIFNYYKFHFKQIHSIISINNNTNMELFFTFYIDLIEKTDIDINNKYLIEYFLINVANAIMRLDKQSQIHQLQLYGKLLEEYIKKTNPSIIFFDKIINFLDCEIILTVYNKLKKIPPYNLLIIAMITTSEANIKKICSAGTQLKKTSLEDMMIYLYNYNIMYFEKNEIFNMLTVIKDSIDFLNDNDINTCNKNLFFKFINNICDRYFTNSGLTKSINKILCDKMTEIISYVIKKKGDITFDQFAKLVKNNIQLKNVTVFGFNLLDTKLCEIYDEFDVNPYNVKYDSTIMTLRRLCKERCSLPKIRQMCKTVKPDIVCLQNLCLTDYNTSIIRYFIDEHNLKFDEICLWNVLSNAKRSPTINLINSYRPQYINNGQLVNTQKVNTPQVNTPQVNTPQVNISKVEEKNNSDTDTDSDSYSDSDELKPVVQPVVQPVIQPVIQPVVKKAIKKVPKKKIDDTKEEKVEEKEEKKEEEKVEYREEIVDGKKIRKKIIKKVVKKDSTKDDSTKSTKSSASTSSTITKDIKPVVVKDTVESKVIPNNYEYRISRKVKDFIKRLLKCNETETHIQLRKKVLEFLNNSTFIDKTKINIKIFDLKKEESIEFINLDKLIFCLFE